MATRPLTFITRPIPTDGIERVKKYSRVQLRSADSVISSRALREGVRRADALLCILTDHVDASIMDAAPRLRVISNFAVGVDNIDVEAATERGIVVTNTPGVLDDAVAEHTLALLLAVVRRVVESDRFTRAHQYKGWMPMGFMGPTLFGKTIGIIGAGRIGTTVARVCANGFGMTVLYHDIARNPAIEKAARARFVSKSQLLRQSDVVSVHVPLLPSTTHLMDTKDFQLMKTGSVLINTSRGPIVFEKALLRALASGRLFGAGLDVFECEPAIDCDLNDRLALEQFDSVVLTPHIASATIEARNAMALLAAQGIVDVLSGRRPKNIVNAKVWSKRRQ